MTFKHKLSCRLALLKDRMVVALVALIGAAAIFACEMPLRVSDTGGTIADLLVSPKILTLRQNATADFTAVAFTSTGDSAIVAVSWTVTNGSIIDTSSNGKRHYGHYKAGQNPGQYKVVATGNPGGVSDTAIVTVTLAPVSSVTVSPAAASVLAGSTAQLTATPLDSLGNALTGRTVTWLSGNTGIATVNASGLVTGVTTGSVTISATSEGQSGAATITVSTVPVASVTVAPASASLQVGQTAQLTATAKDANGNTLSGRVMTWQSSNTSVATVNGSGLVTGAGAGSATITATSEGQSGTSSVTVVFVPVASVTVSPASASLQAAQTLQLTATPKDANGNALSGRVVTWSSSSTAVATVSSAGLVRGVTAGSATITATSEGQSGTSAVTVTAAPVASVTVSPTSAAVQPGQTVQLTATTKDANGNVLTGRVVTWSTSDQTLATVNGSGLVTGVKAGTATITATSEGKSGIALVVVGTPPPPAGCAPTGSGVCRYVDAVAGNDGNPGDSAHPYKTVQHAADVVNPGDMVIVRNGVYTGGSGAVLSIGRGGTAANWVVFKAEHKWGAALDGQGSLGVQGVSDAGVSVGASYVRIEGFEVRWAFHDAFSVNVDNVQVAGNHIHDIGRYCTDDSFGIAAFAGHTGNSIIEQNLIHDIGRLSPGEAGCNPSTDYWQNHDHGVYHGTGNNLIIRNNVFFNITHGWAIHLYSGSVDQLYVVNNTFAFPNPNRNGYIIVAEPLSNSVIANNIFYQPTTAGISNSGGSPSNLTVENNMTANGVAWTGSTSGAAFTNNFDNTDPKLVNPAALDFRLQAGSPAIGAGISLPYVLNDFAGVPRPLGAPYDIGAFQFQ